MKIVIHKPRYRVINWMKNVIALPNKTQNTQPDLELVILERGEADTFPTHINEDQSIAPRWRFAELIHAGLLLGEVKPRPGEPPQICNPKISHPGRERLKALREDRASKTLKGRIKKAGWTVLGVAGTLAAQWISKHLGIS